MHSCAGHAAGNGGDVCGDEEDEHEVCDLHE